jgi:hypothetical protein
MVSMLITLSGTYCGFNPRLGHTKYYIKLVCFASPLVLTLRS